MSDHVLPQVSREEGMGRNSSVPRPIQGGVWVDDFIFVKPVERHPPFNGIDGGCAVCVGALQGARADHDFVIDPGGRLGLGFQDSKRQHCGQMPEYAGFQFDTVLGRLRVLPAKLPKMDECLQEWILSAFTTARGLARIHRRSSHFSLGVQHLRVLIPEVLLVLGTESDPRDKEPEIDWDREIITTDAMAEQGQELLAVIQKGAPAGVEMWPLHPSTLYGRFLRGRYGDLPLFVLTWDAGPNGYAGLLRWWTGRSGGSRELQPEELLLVSTWPERRGAASTPPRDPGRVPSNRERGAAGGSSRKQDPLPERRRSSDLCAAQRELAVACDAVQCRADE